MLHKGKGKNDFAVGNQPCAGEGIGQAAYKVVDMHREVGTAVEHQGEVQDAR